MLTACVLYCTSHNHVSIPPIELLSVERASLVCVGKGRRKLGRGGEDERKGGGGEEDIT